jgi:hypothetical protein
MNKVPMDDIQALYDQIDQLDPKKSELAARHNTPAPHTSPLVEALPK